MATTTVVFTSDDAPSDCKAVVTITDNPDDTISIQAKLLPNGAKADDSFGYLDAMSRFIMVFTGIDNEEVNNG